MDKQPNNSNNPESFRKIQTDEYAPPRFIVSQMISTGVYLFAGSPKIGKSWLALWLCDKVAKGEKVWEYDAEQCTVLYIALEDTKSTLHYRIEDITDLASEQAYAVTSCKSISEGLVDDIDEFIRLHSDTRLVVIDTLQLVRDQGEKQNYAADYSELRLLVEYAHEKDIAIILVHHLRKMPDSDPFNRISGSTGLIGAVDGIMVLEKEARTDNKAKLYITGRRVRDQVLKLAFEENTNIWRFIEYVKNPLKPLEKLINNILQVLQTEKRFKGGASDLLEKIKQIDPDFNMAPNAMSRLLNENSVSLRNGYSIYFKKDRNGTQRFITLSLLKEGDGDDMS